MIRATLQTKDYETFLLFPEAGLEPIPFQGAARAGRAFPGDTVDWNGTDVVSVTRSSARLFLVGTLETTSKTRYGLTSRGTPLYRFLPYSEAYPPFFVGSTSQDTSQNLLVRIEFESWATTSSCPRGILVQTFGPAGDLAAEEAALLTHYAPIRWKGKFATESLHPPLKLPALAGPARTFHIDPPGCRDIDDAISLEELKRGWRVHIHIADVASWLLSNTNLAAVASEIGQTVYKDGRAVTPMFPFELSEGVFSLLPGQPRRAWTLSFDWERGGQISAQKWSLQEIIVRESYTYEEAQGCAWAPALTEIATSLSGHPCLDSHEWIEQLMLHYNKEAASLLLSSSKGGVLRRHAAPDRERFAALEALGLPAARMAQRAGEYCATTETDLAHWGLGASQYCHASSPIRRWADTLNQICLAGILYGATPSPPFEPRIAYLNARAKASKAFERDVEFVRQLLSAGGGLLQITATVVEPGRIWVTEWNRLQKADTGDAAPGEILQGRVYCDATKRNWKRRLVIRLEKSEPL
jgi:exoribonuclease R